MKYGLVCGEKGFPCSRLPSGQDDSAARAHTIMLVASRSTGQGTPALIESTFGNKGRLELVVPFINGNLAYFYCDIDGDLLSWHGPLTFGMNAGKAECASLIQSNFAEPGHLELVALMDGHLSFFWRDFGPDLIWNGPQRIDIH